MTRTAPLSQLQFRLCPAPAGRPLHAPRLRPTTRTKWTEGPALARDQARIAELSEANQAKNECLAHVLGDAVRLEQALGNLLHNASKSTRRGGRIWLSAERRDAPGGASEAVIHIRDEGIGITADMLRHVFDIFKQAGRSPHHSRGLGLGLTLVRHIVQAHGGCVTPHSGGTDQGSEFVVSLPLLPIRA